MTQADRSRSETADLALAAYLEPVLRDQCVLLIDAVDGPLTARLSGLVATLQCVAPDELEIRGSHADAELELPFEADAFDLIWVADVASLPDPRARSVDAFRNAMVADGVLVVCGDVPQETPRRSRSRSRGPVPASSLARLAGGPFDEVMVLGQSRFDGVALEVVDGPEGETGLDQSLTRGSAVQPTRLVAIASDLLPKLEGKLVVRVPSEDNEAAAEDSELVERLELAEGRLRVLDEELEGLRAEAAELDEERIAASKRATAAEREIEAAQLRLDKQRKRAASDKDALDEARGQLRRAEKELDAALRDAPDPAELSALRDEVDALEGRLRETGKHVVELEAEVERRGAVARDLMADLERASAKPAAVAVDPEEARLRVDAMADREVALRAADQLKIELLEAQQQAAARIAELEEQLRAARAEPVQDEATQQDEVSDAYALRGSALMGRDSERVRAMGAELLTYRHHLSERDELAAALEARSAELETERSAARGARMRLDEAERALAARPAAPVAGEDTRVESLGAELEQLREAFDRQRAESDALAGDLEDAQQRVRSLEGELEEADRLAGEAEELSAERDALSGKLSEAQQHASDLKQALNEADDDLEGLRGRAEDAERERDQARGGLGEARVLLQQVATYFSPQGGDPAALARALEEAAGGSDTTRRQLLDTLSQLTDRAPE